MNLRGKKVITIAANTSWYVYNFRLPLIRALQNKGFQVTAVSPGDEYVSRLEDIGCRVVQVKLYNKSTNPLTEIKSIYDFLRIYSTLRPAVALHFTPKPNIYGSIAARSLKIPCVNNIAGLGTAFIQKWFLSRIVKNLYRLSQGSACRVFFQNRDDLEMFLKEGLVGKEKTDLLPGSGVDLVWFRPGFGNSGIEGLRDWGGQGGGVCRQSNENFNQPLNEGQEYLFQASESGTVFLLVARLIWDKGIGEYAEAARLIKAGHPDTEFWLLGFVDENNPGAVPEEAIRAWEAEGILKWLGRQDDVRPFIARADCVVLPSYYREGVPRVLLEGAAMGKPLITANSIGCREPVEDGKTGFLCRPRDARDLAEKMERIINMSHENRMEMGLRGRKKMEREFDEKIVIRKYMDVIEEIVK